MIDGVIPKDNMPSEIKELIESTRAWDLCLNEQELMEKLVIYIIKRDLTAWTIGYKRGVTEYAKNNDYYER